MKDIVRSFIVNISNRILGRFNNFRILTPVVAGIPHEMIRNNEEVLNDNIWLMGVPKSKVCTLRIIDIYC